MSVHAQRIILVELFDHSEVVYNLCKLLDQDRRFKTAVICQSYIIDGASYYAFKHVRFMPLSGRGTLQQQLADYKSTELKKAELVVWVTLPLSCRWIVRDYINCNNVVVLHNLRSWVKPFLFIDWGAAFSLIFWARLIRQLMLRKYQMAILQSSRAILVLGEKLKIYLDQSSRIGHMRKALFLPVAKHAFVSNAATEPEDSFIQIAIPGALIPNKGYEQVIQALEIAYDTLRRPLKVVLLGKVHSSTLLKRFLSLESEELTFKHYDQWIPSREFNLQMTMADFLILPYASRVKFSIIHEKWGVTKASGALRDALLFDKPTLISDNYGDPPDNCIVYKDSNSLADYLISWVNNGVPKLSACIHGNDFLAEAESFKDCLYDIALKGKLD